MHSISQLHQGMGRIHCKFCCQKRIILAEKQNDPPQCTESGWRGCCLFASSFDLCPRNLDNRTAEIKAKAGNYWRQKITGVGRPRLAVDYGLILALGQQGWALVAKEYTEITRQFI